MIPLSVMVTGKGTVSRRIKGRSVRSGFTSELRPVVFWNMTYKCNLKCIHCYIGAGPDVDKPELPLDAKLDIADQMVKQEIPLVVFTGGEPLASPDFWRVVEHLQGYKRPKLSLSTNGTLITSRVAERLRDLGLQYVGISIDSINPETHDWFRGLKGAFKAAIKGVENSVAAGIPTGLRMTITKWNIGEALDLLDLAGELGVERISYYMLDTVGRGSALLEALPGRREVAWFIDSLIEAARRYEGKMEILLVRLNQAGIYLADKLARSREEFHRLLDIVEGQGDCGRKTVSIYPDGTVRPCQFIDYIIVGDLKRESLASILSTENPRLKPFLEPWRNLKGPMCSGCPFKRVCGGGSRNRALRATGDLWGDDPACFLDVKSIAERWGLL